MVLYLEDVVRLLMAMVVGGLVGFERSYRDKAAGLRTYVFICMGAALFTILSFRLGDGNDVRIAVGIVSGVGFLGAGVIMRDAGRVTGLTTASGVWLSAALGMGIGGGQYVLTTAATIIVLFVLWVFRPLEDWVDALREERTYEVTTPVAAGSGEAMGKLFTEAGLKIHGLHRAKVGGKLVSTWNVSGTTDRHERVIQRLLEDVRVEEFRF